MSDLESVSLRIFQEMAALLAELEPGREPPARGQKIPEEMNALGAKAAEHWLRTGRRPTSQEEIQAVFPRFWFANMFLKNALLHRTRQVIPLGRPTAMPAVLMLEVWESSGRQHYEAAKPDVPWGG